MLVFTYVVVVVVVVIYFPSLPVFRLPLTRSSKSLYKCKQSSEVDASSLRGHCNVASLELLTAIAYPNAAPLALATLHDSLACRADWI